MAKRYIISAGHPLTADAARHALDAGGNAFDAALSGWLAACLAEPVLTSPGGSGFAMVAPASSPPRLYDFFSQTPLRANPDGHAYPLEADFGSTTQIFHLGAGTVATPGCVAGILQIQETHGRLPLEECAAPALELSRNGLIITEHAATLLKVVKDLYLATPDSRRLFQSRREQTGCLREGERFLNHDFEVFIDALIAEGSRWFYEGDIGRIISDYCQQHEGHLTREDFTRYKVEVRDPLEIRRNGSTVWLNPPPSMGGTLIAIGLLSRGKAASGSFPVQGRSAWLDWAEPLRLMSLLRSQEGSRQLDEEDGILLQKAFQLNEDVAGAAAQLFPHALEQVQSMGTTHISIMDGDGNEIAMTTSNGAGSAIIPSGTGFMLNNMLGEDDLQPEGLGTWKPDTRLSSMMAPTLARLADGSRIATGSGGSNRIRSTILQILRHLIDHRLSLAEAVEAPRLHWENGELHAETGAAQLLRELDQSLPWPLVEHSVPNLFFGGAHSVAWSDKSGFSGIGDPRRGGISIGK
ncbi:MAG: gamma-glutamyltransferase [Puniceicoccaceae bacterium]